MADARKSLQVLYDEWSNCRSCELGQRRLNLSQPLVFGEGIPRGVMFIGEGPGVVEESVGRPFVGKSGDFLRGVLDKMHFTNFYLTNIVTCRSCEPVLDPATNLPRLRKNGDIMLADKTPTPLQMESCGPRIHEEIYIVDPVVIVALGATAAQFLLQRPVAITKERGHAQHCSIPGATSRPVLTDKKRAWARKVSGDIRAPVEPNEVRYLVVPTIHPAYVLRNLADRSVRGAFHQFVNDIRMAVKIYERYLSECLGQDPTSISDADLTTVGAHYESEEEG